MEKVRAALTWIARYHFWLLSALVPLVALGSWYMATAALQDQYDTNKGKIKSAFDTQKGLVSRSFYPNKDVNEKQQDQIDLLAADVTEIWQELYDGQRKEVLQWPAQLPDSFVRNVSNMEFGDRIDSRRCGQYVDYIKRRFDDLPKIIDANEIEEGTSGRGGGLRGGEGRGFGGMGGGGRGFGGRGEEDDMLEVDYTVYWSDGDQQRIKDDLTWGSTVSHWQVWTTQEDLWVYQNLLTAIADTNKAKGADRRSNAAITDVFFLEVGKLAAQESRSRGRIRRLEKASSDLGGERDMMVGDRGGGEEEPMEGDFGRGGGEFGERGGEGGGDSGNDKQRLLSRRYIDIEGMPISVPSGNEPLEPDQFGKEIKQLPVRLVVDMDIRWLTTLVTELANADLQIKVTEVRVNPDNTETGGGGGGRGGRGGEMMGGRGEMGGRGGFGGGGGGNQDILAFEQRPYKKRVIIQGVVLIFNKPNLDLLESDAGDDDLAEKRETGDWIADELRLVGTHHGATKH